MASFRDLLQDDINSIMKTLELDEDVSSIVSATGQRVFMKKRKGAGTKKQVNDSLVLMASGSQLMKPLFSWEQIVVLGEKEAA